MKVALFTETYFPMLNGVTTHVKTLKDGLESLGHEVLVVTASSLVKKHVIKDGVLYCPAVKVKKIYGYDVASPLSAGRLKILKKFKPDIIHIHNEYGIGISGIFISKILKVPLVYTLHTMYDDYVYYVVKRKHARKIFTHASHRYAKGVAKMADALTGPSKKVEEYFKRCGVDKPVEVIPNSVELDLFSPAAQPLSARGEMRIRYGFSDSDVIFAFCGRLGQEKNVGALLEFTAQTVKPDDKLKLLIIGDGPCAEQFKKLSLDLGLSDIAKFTGKIPHDELPLYYAACDAYITASLSEMFSISMLEAMAMELPVVHIMDELNQGQIIDGENGYIYKDANEMYAIMKKIRDMPEGELKMLKSKVRETVLKYGSASLAQRLLNVYEPLLGI